MALVDRLCAISPLPRQLAAQLCNEGVALLRLRHGQSGEELLCFYRDPSRKLRGLLLGQLDQASRDLLDSVAPGMSCDQQCIRDL